jgi:hypothetical protein
MAGRGRKHPVALNGTLILCPVNRVHARAPVSAEDDEADALVSRVADDLMRYAARQEGGFQRAACC